jgi:hypothetical protein
MKDMINAIFGFIDTLFNKIPFLKKIEGYRSVIGLVGLAAVAVMQKNGLGNAELLDGINTGLLVWTGFSLNSKRLN